MKYSRNSIVRSTLVTSFWVAILSLMTFNTWAEDYWRSERITPVDLDYIKVQHAAIDELARRHFGRILNGDKHNDISIVQRLLDEKVIDESETRQLQAVGIILGELLRVEHHLNWVVYVDKYGRSRALQVQGFEKDFIFPATQVSRKAEVGILVNVMDVYKELEKTITTIRKKPPF
jgi:hypothetical protein